MTLPMPWRLPFLAALLFFSGACALVYQMAWLRELRLVFGGSTPATAAVLAIFMGGLGVGSALFGRRVEASANPLGLYARIELGVGLSALAAPLLLVAVRALYLRTGGIVALGLVPATLLQLLLATVVLAVPCILMGGSLPAAFKWAETDQDRQRGALGVLYGVNTLGAVVGVLAGTFWLLEHWGIHATVWSAAAANLLIAAAAWAVARREAPAPPPATAPAPERALTAPPWFVYLAAGVTGFTFFLCELVWYRLLAPLVGSSVYGFGLILALALTGIGLGGLAYRWGWAARPGAVSLPALAMVAGVQALLLAAPWALGDTIAVLAADVQQLRALGMSGQVVAWSLVTGLLVVGPALLAGVQFPLLVGLLGEGARDAGRHVGNAYAANTLGAIAGALAGGFLLLPTLTAPGSWRLATLLTLALSLGAILVGPKHLPRRAGLAVLALWIGAAWLMIAPVGPTAAWRHQPIGYGRLAALPNTVNGLRHWLNEARRDTVYELEGREASVAVIGGEEGYAFYINGKSDGSAMADADTQVMLGLLPALLHPRPERAFVVGLGTGTSAGWLADVAGMARVDVAELEPGLTRLARDHFRPVNRDVLAKPNVKLILGDAREALLTSGPSYDLIVSEPSNPYRAGVATLFTREFYQAVKGRLAPGGLFAQWLQGYEIDARAVRTVYATLAAEFPYVEVWATGPGDLLFIGQLDPPAYPMAQLRQRVNEPPFDEALRRVWYTDSAEGVLARHLATPALREQLLAADTRLNTDDRNVLEYGFARALAQDNAFDVGQVARMAAAAHVDLPAHLAGEVDRDRLARERLLMLAAAGGPVDLPAGAEADALGWLTAVRAFVDQRYADVLSAWTDPATSPMERLMLLESAAMAGTPEQVAPLVASARADWPADAHFAAAQVASRHGAPEQAVEQLRAGFTALREQVWARPTTVAAALKLVPTLAAAHPDRAALFLDLLRAPFPAGLAQRSRLNAVAALGPHLPPARQAEVAALFEPHPPWQRPFLEFRLSAYLAAGNPRAAQAARDLAEYLRHSDRPLDE